MPQAYALDIPVGKIFPSDKFNVSCTDNLVSAIPKGIHEYYLKKEDKYKKVEGEFPHVTMVPFNENQLEEAQKNAGKDDFVLKCLKYHVTGQGEVRIWRQFQLLDGGSMKSIKDSQKDDSNIGLELVYSLHNLFLSALEGQLKIDISV